MIMYKAFHQKNDMDKLQISRKEEGRGPTCIEENAKTT